MAHLALAVLVALALASPSLLVAQGEAPAGGGNTGDGSNAFTGVGSAPEASLFVGAATMSIPFEVPPGRKTITPRLGLSYSSGAGFSPYGYGWDLPLGKIQRSVKNGVLSCTDVSQHDDFVVVLPGSSAECTLEGSTCQPLIQEAAVAVEYDATGNVWTVRDVAGMRYTFGESDARTGSQTSTLFASGSPCAYTYSWGLTEIRDTNDNYLTVEYVREDGVLYPAAVRYGGNSAAGIAHMFHVEFDFVTDPDARTWSTSGAGGFLAVTKKRLENVRVKAPGAGAFVRRYRPVYNNWDVYNARVLESVEVYGGDPDDPFDNNGILLTNATTGPAATTAEYETYDLDAPAEKFQDARQSLAPLPLANASRMSLTVVNSGGDYTSRGVVDINGEGFRDLADFVWDWDCEAAACGLPVGCTNLNVYLGGPSGWDPGDVVEWSVPLRTLADQQFGQCLFDLGDAGLSQSIRDDDDDRVFQKVLDITGDGVADWIRPSSIRPAAGSEVSHDGRWEVFPGRYDETNGTWGFDLDDGAVVVGTEVVCPSAGPCAQVYVPTGGGIYWPAPFGDVGFTTEYSGELGSEFGDPGHATLRDLVDMNGDGLVDYVAGRGIESSGFDVWYNTGSGFESGPGTFVPSAYGMISLTTRDNCNQLGECETKQVLGLYDINGDGLPDQIAAANPPTPAGLTTWDVYLNNGHAMVGPYEWSIGGSDVKYLSYTTRSKQVTRDFFDVNGDGLPDVVDARNSSNTWNVWLNRGNDFAGANNSEDRFVTWSNTPDYIRDAHPERRSRDTFDADGDGLVDYVEFTASAISIRRNGRGAWCAATSQNGPCLTDGSGAAVVPRLEGRRPLLLIQSENGVGGDTFLHYRPSTQWTASDPGEMPFVSWTLSAIEQRDGLCHPENLNDCLGPPDAVHVVARDIVYSNGKFDPETREFRGFGKVEEYDGAGNLRVSHFEQSRALKGKITQVEEYSADPGGGTASAYDFPVRTRREMWGCFVPGTQTPTLCGESVPVYVQKLSDVQRDFSNYSTSQQKWVANVNVDYAWCDSGYTGQVEETWITSNDGVPYTTTRAEFSCMPAEHIFDRPVRLQTMESGNVLEESWYLYDAKGNLLRTEALLAQPGNSPPAFGEAPAAGSCTLGSGSGCAVTTMEVDPVGNVIRVTDPKGRTTRTEFDPATRIYPWIVTSDDGGALARSVGMQHNVACGTLEWQTLPYAADPNADPPSDSSPHPRTRRAYDPFCRLWKTAHADQTLDEPAQHFEYRLGSHLHPSWVRLWRREGGAYVQQVQFSDALGRPIQSAADANIFVPGFTEPQLRSVASATLVYDEVGAQARSYAPFVKSQSPTSVYEVPAAGLAYSAKWYDSLGRVVRAKSFDDEFREVDYSVAWQSSATDECWSDPDCEGARTVAIHDSRGRLVERQLYSENGVLEAKTRMTWDGLGRQLTSTQWDGTGWNPATTVVSEFDTLGRLVRRTEPDSGVWTTGYDLAGNVVYRDDPAIGNHLQYCHDRLGRVTREYVVATDVGSNYIPQSCGLENQPGAVEYLYDDDTAAWGFGQLAEVLDESGVTDFLDYDVRGRPVAIAKGIADGSSLQWATMEYDYDENDRVTAVHYPDGDVVAYQYDPVGQLDRIESIDGEVFVEAVHYDLMGRVVRIAHGNGVDDVRTYGPAEEGSRLESIVSGFDGSGIEYLNLQYTGYTAHGLLTEVQDGRVGTPTYNSNVSAAARYEYDGLRRLTLAELKPGLPGAEVRTYDHDKLGNLTMKDGRTLTYGDPQRPHRLTGVVAGTTNTTVAHDANGNRTHKGGDIYTIDARNRVAEIDATTGPLIRSVYDYTGRRVAKVEGADTTRYFSADVHLERSAYWYKYFSVAGLRVAMRRTPFATAALDRDEDAPVMFAALATRRDAVALVVRDERAASGIPIAGLLLVGLVLAPRGRGRLVAVLRAGRSAALVVVMLVGTSPLPFVLLPLGAEAVLASGGGGGGGGSGGAELMQHFHHDRLGTAMVVTNHEGGTVVRHLRYGPYGELRGVWEPNFSPRAPASIEYGFTGYELEEAGGLQYAGARFHDPDLGSFLSLDPAREFANPYAYVGWDPINATDPTGECVAICLLIAVGIAFVAGFANAMIHGASVGQALGAGYMAGMFASFTALSMGGLLAPLAEGMAGFYGGTVGLGETASSVATAMTLGGPSAVYGLTQGDYAGAIGLGIGIGIMVSGLGALAQQANDMGSRNGPSAAATKHRAMVARDALATTTDGVQLAHADPNLGPHVHVQHQGSDVPLATGEVSYDVDVSPQDVLPSGRSVGRGHRMMKATGSVLEKLRGYTRHGLNQAIGRDGGRGVSIRSILEAVKSPNRVVPTSGGSTRYVGGSATVILNRDGKVITTYGSPRDPSAGR